MKSSTIVIVHTYVCVKNLPLIKITMVRKKCPITGLFITLSQQNRLLHFSTLSSHYMLLSSSHKTVDSVTNFMHLFLPQNVSKKSDSWPWNSLLLEIKLAVPKNWFLISAYLKVGNTDGCSNIEGEETLVPFPVCFHYHTSGQSSWTYLLLVTLDFL